MFAGDQEIHCRGSSSTRANVPHDQIATNIGPPIWTAHDLKAKSLQNVAAE